MPEAEYVTQEVFDMQVKSFRERDDLIDRLSDARMERMEALVDRTLAQIREDNSQLRADLKVMNARIDQNLSEYKAIASEMQGNLNANVARLEGKIDAVNAKVDTLQNKFSWNIAWMGIIIGVVLAVIQHFWK